MRRIACGLLLCLSVYSALLSATEVLDPNLRRGLKRDLSTGPQPYVEPKAGAVDGADAFEPLPPPPDSGLSAAGAEITLAVIHLQAPPEIDQDAFAELIKTYLGRPLHAEDLEDLRQELAEVLQQAGYLGAHVSLPDQDVRDGELSYSIQVTRLERIEIAGAGRLSLAELRRPLAHLEGTLLRLDVLQAGLREIDADPRVARLDATLKPAGQPFSARLDVAVEAAPAQSVGLRFGNDRPESSGRERGALFYSNLNLLGRHDELDLEYGASEGADDWSAYYHLPIAASPISLLLGANKSDVRVIAVPFDRIDIQGESREESIGLGWWWLRSSVQSAEWSLGVDRNRSKSTLLGEPFSFAPGEIDGGSRVAALRAMLRWERRAEQWAQAALLRVSHGLSSFDATVHGDELPDSRFNSIYVQAQHLQNFGDAYDWSVRAAGQWADDALLPSEKLALGGDSSIRGAETNILVRDNGWLLSAEARRRYEPRLNWLDDAALGMFADYGYGSNNDGFLPASASLGTVGLFGMMEGRQGWLRVNIGHPMHQGGALDAVNLDDWRITAQMEWRLDW